MSSGPKNLPFLNPLMQKLVKIVLILLNTLSGWIMKIRIRNGFAFFLGVNKLLVKK